MAELDHGLLELVLVRVDAFVRVDKRQETCQREVAISIFNVLSGVVDLHWH